MQSIAETCVRFDAAHLSINLVSEIAVPMFTTLRCCCLIAVHVSLHFGLRMRNWRTRDLIASKWCRARIS